MDREDIHEFITRCRPYMIEDLQNDVIKYLHECKCLTDEELNEINRNKTRENRIIHLLDIIPSKSKECYKTFGKFIEDQYCWIKDKGNEIYMNQDHNSKRVRKILSEAEVPPLPSIHVSRKDEFILLVDYLSSMKRGEFVVVNGMGGCGKSTLVLQVLHESYSLVLDTFQEKIFWLTIGRDSALKKDVEKNARELTILQELYTRIFTARGYSPPPLPVDINSAMKVLKNKFRESELKNCLLILDDVPSSNYINCLKIGCKTLVTTDDTNIMAGISNVKVVKISEGFHEDESLELFSKNLDPKGIIKLPDEAKRIHALCKGFPLTISLIASQLASHKDDVLINPDRWNTYIKHLKEKNLEAAIGRFDKYRQNQLSLLYKALNMSICSLDPQLQRLYQDFALFMDDVNIKTEVLCTLWELDKKEVEDVMSEFEKKCLVIRTWNVQLLSYVYSVHDLLLDYLKRNLTTSETQELHRKLIAMYQKKFGDDYINFPKNDNYIFLYLAYHLKEAGYFEEFPKLYFDLKYIEVKIMTHGPADLLYDLKKYKDLIANNEKNVQKYEEVFNFITKVGVCRVLSCSDIVQFGLAECKKSWIYRKSFKLAKSSEKRYFEYLTETPKDCSVPRTHFRKEKIINAIFTSDGNVIYANEKGLIKLWHLGTDEIIASYKGHTKKITHLRLLKNAFRFISAAEDSIIRVWDSIPSCNILLDKPRTPSPQLAQQAHCDPWAGQRPSALNPILELKLHSEPIVDVQSSNTGMMVVSSGRDNNVIIWKFMYQKETGCVVLYGRKIISVEETVVSCSFSTDDEHVICATATGLISIYDANKGRIMSSVKTESLIKSIAVLPDIQGSSDIHVTMFGENFMSLHVISRENMNEHTLKNCLKFNSLRKRHDNLICSAISSNGKYVALASTNHNILIREIETDREVVKFHENNGTIRGLDWSGDNLSLMATYENETIKLWNVEDNDKAVEVKLKQSVFDAAFVTYQDDDDHSYEDTLLVSAVLDNANNIHVYHDLRPQKVIKQKSSDECICQICVSPSDGSIIYATKTGALHLVNLDEWSSQNLLNIDCNEICKMKLYSHQSNLTVLLLIRRGAEYSLVAWIKNESEEGYQKEFAIDGSKIIEFLMDVKTSNVFVARSDFQCEIYDLKTTNKISTLQIARDELESAKYADSSSDTYAVGNHSFLVLNGKSSIERKFDDAEATICKFSHNGKYLAVGFKNGRIKVYDLETEQCIETADRGVNVLDLSWSNQDDKLMVVLDRDIILYEVFPNELNLASCVYMSVDKLVYNHFFTKVVTIDHTELRKKLAGVLRKKADSIN